jgi:translation initiation factor 2B subunit (eIF-2B alpha/beta/delta family)
MARKRLLPLSSTKQLVGSTALRAVAENRTAGAQALAVEALGVVADELRAWRKAPPSDLPRLVRDFARSLSRTQPAMGVFPRWSAEWARAAAEVPERELLRHLTRWTRTWRRRISQEPGRIARVARRWLPPQARILTLSRSDSVRRALTVARGARRPREVVVLESQPGGEGRGFARELRRSGLRARVVPDAKGRGLVRRMDLVLIGADAVWADGSVVHKVGTRPLALAAHQAGVPVIVVTGRSKWVPRTRPARGLPPTFDRTPARSIREYWTDGGRVRRASWNVRAVEKR